MKDIVIIPAVPGHSHIINVDEDGFIYCSSCGYKTPFTGKVIDGKVMVNAITSRQS